MRIPIMSPSRSAPTGTRSRARGRRSSSTSSPSLSAAFRRICPSWSPADGRSCGAQVTSSRSSPALGDFQQAVGGYQREPRGPPRHRVEFPEPDPLHRPVATRGRRIQTSPTRSIAMSRINENTHGRLTRGSAHSHHRRSCRTCGRAPFPDKTPREHNSHQGTVSHPRRRADQGLSCAPVRRDVAEAYRRGWSYAPIQVCRRSPTRSMINPGRPGREGVSARVPSRAPRRRPGEMHSRRDDR